MNEPPRFNTLIRSASGAQSHSPLSESVARPRVAHVITRLIVGGAQENTLASVVELRRRGRFDADLILGPTHGPEGTLVPAAREQGVEPHLVPSLRREVNPVLDPVALAALAGVFRRGRYDVVHTHSSKAGVLGRLAARLARVPLVVHTVHGWGFNDRQRPLVHRSYRGARALVRRLHRRPGHRDPARHGGRPGAPHREASSLQHDSQRHRHRAFRDTGPVTRGGTGRARPGGAPPGGGERDAARAAEGAPGRHRGSRPAGARGARRAGPDRRRRTASRNRRAALPGLEIDDRVVFTGLRPDVPDLLAASDVLVLASLWEGLPRVIPQAMAASLPVVATAVAGNAEAVVDGVTGLLVPPHDPTALGAALAALLSDGDRARALGAAGRARVDAFSVHRMVDDIEALYARLLAAR